MEHHEYDFNPVLKLKKTNFLKEFWQGTTSRVGLIFSILGMILWIFTILGFLLKWEAEPVIWKMKLHVIGLILSIIWTIIMAIISYAKRKRKKERKQTLKTYKRLGLKVELDGDPSRIESDGHKLFYRVVRDRKNICSDVYLPITKIHMFKRNTEGKDLDLMLVWYLDHDGKSKKEESIVEMNLQDISKNSIKDLAEFQEFEMTRDPISGFKAE
ncbi:MAG: hypothetical protein Q4E53_12335 [Eubacteriales bacterium]|nr:hypothetical protein [Eubacteriales bacterium]